MSYQIECEKRVMLTLEQYHRLLEDYVGEDHFILNEYLDNENSELHDEKLMLRLRSVDNNPQIELTLKVKQPDGDIEITDLISIEQKADIIRLHQLPDGDVKSYLEQMGLSTINMIIWGHIEVKRREIKNDKFTLVLDENHILDVVDYNLEIEASNVKKAEKLIKNICEKYQINYSEKYYSKSRRTYMIYHGLNINN